MAQVSPSVLEEDYFKGRGTAPWAAFIRSSGQFLSTGRPSPGENQKVLQTTWKAYRQADVRVWRGPQDGLYPGRLSAEGGDPPLDFK